MPRAGRLLRGLVAEVGETSDTDPLRIAAAAYLARCTERNLEPLFVQRAQVELYVGWLQEILRLVATLSRWRDLSTVGRASKFESGL